MDARRTQGTGPRGAALLGTPKRRTCTRERERVSVYFNREI